MLFPLLKTSHSEKRHWYYLNDSYSNKIISGWSAAEFIEPETLFDNVSVNLNKIKSLDYKKYHIDKILYKIGLLNLELSGRFSTKYDTKPFREKFYKQFLYVNSRKSYSWDNDFIFWDPEGWRYAMEEFKTILKLFPQSAYADDSEYRIYQQSKISDWEGGIEYEYNVLNQFTRFEKKFSDSPYLSDIFQDIINQTKALIEKVNPHRFYKGEDYNSTTRKYMSKLKAIYTELEKNPIIMQKYSKQMKELNDLIAGGD